MIENLTYPVKVFVYGTLRKGWHGHRTFLKDKEPLFTARVNGSLYHLPFGYPVAVECEDSEMTGEVYEVDKDTLRSLREYEGVFEINPVYREKIVKINGVDVIMFTANPSKERAVKTMGLRVEGGDWAEFAKHHKTGKVKTILSSAAAAFAISLSF
ncbi:gamma-glutamylcyclotransferase family protein [Limisalsivibrio acetivorans]|uniref:gamma-glutamylcyclotransferase family protein n=1 Tax=Limisalsivibrio acetivorans TaxID=1304888 RepID=UPI0003B675E8|nr:gamma-glutamylcyclotransferase family protein [Limisalsivibrio acetivorans]